MTHARDRRRRYASKPTAVGSGKPGPLWQVGLLAFAGAMLALLVHDAFVWPIVRGWQLKRIASEMREDAESGKFSESVRRAFK